MFRIGYACLTVGVEQTRLGAITRKNADETRLLALIERNLRALENMVRYNTAAGIKLFRISSDLIPFGSSSVNRLPWWDIFAPDFARIGSLARQAGMRLSMHPGQYTILNSPRREVAQNAMADLQYHLRVLEALETGEDNKIILHVGGAYGNKEAALQRFRENWQNLAGPLQRRLALENDERLFNIADVLNLAETLHLPVIFDNLHHALNSPAVTAPDKIWVEACAKTWSNHHGPQKVHYSQQGAGKKRGAHSRTIYADPFLCFFRHLRHLNLDVMLEVKDKNLSALKCLNLTAEQGKIATLEKEWSRYKYSILERSPQVYEEIRCLLRDKNCYPVREFYNLLDSALDLDPLPGCAINAAEHVWGYFKNRAGEKERLLYSKGLENYRARIISLRALKNRLKKIALHFEERYLLDSHYFTL